MKIAVVGCGALGGYYGSKLALKPGHAVHFLLRSDFDVVRRDGFRIEDASGATIAHPICAREPQDIGPADLVVIGLKTTANGQFRNLLGPLISPETTVLTLQNGLGNEEQLAEFVPPAQIMGGLCFVCLNRTAPGVVRHMDHGRVVLGEFTGPATERTRAIQHLFCHAGIECAVTDNLAKAHWEKLVWNVPFNGLGVAAAAGIDAVVTGEFDSSRRLGRCMSTKDLLDDPEWTQLVGELMNEVIGAADALGYSIPLEFAEKQMARTRTMGAYKASTLLDFECGRPLELDSLFLEPLRQAQKAGVETLRLEALCRVLNGLDTARNRRK